MTAGEEALLDHLGTGCTTVCRAWAVTRMDGVVMGFTDHDRDLAFEGVAFRAGTGLSARALQQTTGLSVDNSEAAGALSSAAVTEDDIIAGRYDGAEVWAWLVNWRDVTQRLLQFRGSLGEIVRAGGMFRAELRGLTEALNRLQGRAYQRDCAAILGDRQCGVDLSDPSYHWEGPVQEIAERRLFTFEGVGSYPANHFERGRFKVVSGEAAGLVGLIKSDQRLAGGRAVELWQQIGPAIASGDLVRLEAGCDRGVETCRSKFNNFINFRGFPHVPGEDWLISYPVSSGRNDGGSLRS